MKSLLVLFVFTMATSAFAMDKKCFGTGDAKGESFLMKLSSLKVVIISDDSQNLEAGTYTRNKSSVVHGRDGVTYLDFDLGVSDGFNDLLVDEDLLKKGTSGLTKVRNRGEGFFNVTYICHDPK